MCKYDTTRLQEYEWDYKLLHKAAEGTCKSEVFYHFKKKNLKFKVVGISRVKSRSKFKEESSNPANPNLMMFHGTHCESIKGIFRNGFRVPAEASHGRRFGKAVYLTPSSAYALRFCFSHDMVQDFEIKPDGLHKVKILVCAIAVQPSDLLTYDVKDQIDDKRDQTKEAESGFKRFKERYSPNDLNFKYDSKDRVINVGPIEDRGTNASTNKALKEKVDEYCVCDPKDVVPSYVIEYEVSWTQCEDCKRT